MLFFFFNFGTPWGPLFHQNIAHHFLHSHFPNISKDQQSSFIFGAIYADGIDKTFSHHIQPIYKKISICQQKNETQNNPLYWFYLGLVTHIIPDTFAHAGHRPSFIAPKGILHVISEILIDSLIYSIEKPKFMQIKEDLRNFLEKDGVVFTSRFPYLYKFDWAISHIPIYKFLRFIQSNGCPSKKNYLSSFLDFKNHLKAMQESLEENFEFALRPDCTDQEIRIATTAKVYSLQCL